jgi:hypothetical protein
MKRLFSILCLVVLLSAVSTPVSELGSALAFTTLGCTTAADYGWAHWGWNMVCYYETVSIDPGDYDWDWNQEWGWER